MWSPLLAPGLALLDGPVYEVRALAQTLTHHVVHDRKGAVLWCDGDHGFNPYDFAELNLVHGFDAADGAERVLVKRCMTPFQWDTVLTKHLPAKLEETPTDLAMALPYDRLFSTDELQPWEQIDYVAYSLELLRSLAHEHQVPILLGADIPRWYAAHPQLARMTLEGVQRRWALGRERDGSISVASVAMALETGLGRQMTLEQFVKEERPTRVELPPMRVARSRS